MPPPTEILAASPDAIERAARALERGALVVVPTDTLYGLAADATNRDAVRRALDAKGRPPGRPLPLLVSGASMARRCAASWPPQAQRLAEAFWPGALTIVVPAAPWVCDEVRAGGTTVGVRAPDHATALALIERLDRPVVGTSANASGEPPARTASDAARSLRGDAELALDAGPSPIGSPSTVVALESDGRWRVVREGAIGPERLERALKARKAP